MHPPTDRGSELSRLPLLAGWTKPALFVRLPHSLPMTIPFSSRLFLPLLAALSLTHLGASAAEGFKLQDTAGDHLDVLHDGKLIARYMYAHDVSTPARRVETYKPFLQVFDVEGATPITKSAGGVLTHHRGIFVGWNQIKVEGKTYDRWHMKGGDQVHEKFLTQAADQKRATFTSLVHWEGEKPEQSIIDEERTLTFLPGVAPVYAIIELSSKLKAVMGDTSLNADPEHSGLHYRPADNIDRPKTTYLYPKAGATPHQDHDYPWIGENYFLGPKQYSVVYLNHPSNPKGSITSAFRDYGRFGETWSLTIPKGQTQEFRARFLVATGEMLTPEVIQKAWNEYAGEQAPVPQVTSAPAEKSNFPDPNHPSAKSAPQPPARNADAPVPAN